MPKKPTTQQQLLAENQDLLARLEKAEESLREILSGEADALFVSGVSGGQLFALKGADQSYRTLIENMSEGALTLTPEGLVLYANRRFAEMLRAPLEKVIGSGIHDWFAAESRQVLQTLLRNDAVDNRREELVLAAADGTQVPVYLSVSRHILDEIDSVCMVATDLTEQKRNEEIFAAEKLSNAILEQAADAIVICDETGRIIRASKQAHAFYDKNLLGQPFEHAFPLHQLDGSAFPPVGVIDTNRRLSVEARLEHNGQGFDLLVSVGHLNGARNELLGSVVTLTDITERKQSEELLHRKQSELRVLIDLLPAMIWFKDTENRILRVNKHVAQAAGMSVDEIEGKPSIEIYPQDAAKYYVDDLEVIRSGKSKLAIVETVRGPDNKVLWVQTDKVPFCDNDGKVLGICVMAQDITERRSVEEEIKFKNTMLLTQQETSLDAILVVDENGHIISYNQQFIDLWRLSPQLVSAHLDAPLLQSAADQAENSAAFVAGVQYLYEHRDEKSREEIKLKDGRVIDRYSASIKGADGRYYGRVWYFRDITERKQAELELRESERRFSDLLGNVELVSMMLDREARITYCNDYLLRLTGWKREEVIGKNWFELFVPPEISDLKDTFAALLANHPEAMHHENEIIIRSGERRLIRWNNSVLRSGAGDVIGTASIGEDITERKMAEEVFRQRAAELERFHRLSVGRELQMIELKKQINELAIQAGQKPPYELAFLTPEPVMANPDHEKTS